MAVAGYFKRAIKNIKENGFISCLTIVTISLLVLMVSTFILFIDNAGRVMDSWKTGIRIMVYLKPDLSDSAIDMLKEKISDFQEVEEVWFIPREQALDLLKKQMGHQAPILDDLKVNPLPDAFEIAIGKGPGQHALTYDQIQILAANIRRFSQVEQVEYGQQWLERFSSIFDFFRMIGFAIGSVIVFAATFILANTIRLIVYARQDELQIMRLVGAYDRFIKTPFYLQSIILGGLGAAIGLAVLYAGYNYWFSSAETWFLSVDIGFLSSRVCMVIIFSSMFLGWLGCHFSLKKFLKD